MYIYKLIEQLYTECSASQCRGAELENNFAGIKNFALIFCWKHNKVCSKSLIK